MADFSFPRIDKDKFLRKYLLKYCRLRLGETWNDPTKKHKVGCLDISDKESITQMMSGKKAALAVHDPPYNLIAFNKLSVEEFVRWSKEWIELTYSCLKINSSLYLWLGADHKNHFEPFAEFILMMKDSGFESKNFITLRNQRGYGTQKNWMSIRQELLYYVKRNPVFNIEAVYTEIPKILRGYYKVVNGTVTENLERSKSHCIRSGNVWVDIQQVFYLMDENVNGCYAQKPLKAIDRIIRASSKPNDIVIDFFAHAGTTLLASELLKRKCYTIDIDPVYCEITIRRLERYRTTGKLGWQNSNPFEKEIAGDKKLKNYLSKKVK
ncbi:MAG: DNA methylase [Ignavibacteria bacterium RBG_13_36_8]|nr:MAG: DNA methylase [Ignavibacteria bacterium RBG_13_36_8]